MEDERGSAERRDDHPGDEPSPRSDAARSREEATERSPDPGNEMLAADMQRDGDQRERGENRDGVAVHRPGQAMQPVPAETLPPVQVRLDVGERETRRSPQRDEAPELDDGSKTRLRHLEPRLKREALPERKYRESHRNDRGGGGEKQRNGRHHDEPGPPDGAPELEREQRRRGERVRHGAGREHDQSRGPHPDDAPGEP